MNTCIFCKIIKKEVPAEIVYQDEQVIVFKDIRPKARVHLLLVSLEHIKSLNEINEQHNVLISHMISLLPKLAKEHNLANGFRTIINTGSGGGQEIDHLHFHLIGGGVLPKF